MGWALGERPNQVHNIVTSQYCELNWPENSEEIIEITQRVPFWKKIQQYINYAIRISESFSVNNHLVTLASCCQIVTHKQRWFPKRWDKECSILSLKLLSQSSARAHRTYWCGVTDSWWHLFFPCAIHLVFLWTICLGS